MINIPFNKPFLTGRELDYISQAHAQGQLSGDGSFTRKCHAWLQQRTGCAAALLTNSCTAALEMAAILADVGPGAEVIMPSYTFVSTANAFVLRGGVPVFCDIRPDTLNLDESKLESAITSRTKAVVAVHYAGVACEMAAIQDIANRYGLLLIEDTAQGIMSAYRGRELGSMGHLGTISFHETKNIISGEGGALIVNDPSLVERAEIIREKGTDRSRFLRGQVDKYTWVDLGSSFLPSELTAAFLWAQMEEAQVITQRRLAIWRRYHEAFEEIEREGLVRRPIIPQGLTCNGHMYYLLLPNLAQRQLFIAALNNFGIQAVFHYVPLHGSPAGRRYGRTSGSMEVTNDLSLRLVRLPLWVGLEGEQDRIIDAVKRAARFVSCRS